MGDVRSNGLSKRRDVPGRDDLKGAAAIVALRFNAAKNSHSLGGFVNKTYF